MKIGHLAIAKLGVGQRNMLIGMRMAYSNIDGKHYCCMLPMKVVEVAINQI